LDEVVVTATRGPKRIIVGLMAGAAALLGAASAEAAGASCPNPGFERDADAAIRTYEQADLFSGALLLAVDGRPVLRRGVGLAERELGVAATPDMKFRVGSLTKQFTAAAILQLQEAGKLSIDDPISKYYPEAPQTWAKITLRHLLTHTSGILSYTALPGFFAREAREPHTPEELIKLTRDKPLQSEPGSKYEYNNTGYIILGYVIEKVSGQPYAQYLQQHVFTPLGMSGSGYDDPAPIIKGRAAGYARGPDGAWRNAPFIDMSVPYAAGSLYSTVNDLLVWDQALYGARLLKPDSLQAMFTDYGHQYGFGVHIDQKWDQERIWHNGIINGFSASLQRYPKSRITVVALSNEMIPPATDKLADDLAGLCLGAAVYPKEVAETPAALARYAGYYEFSPVAVLQVEPRGGVLISHMAGQPDGTLYPEGGGKFFSRTAEIEVSFQTGSDGQVTGANARINGQPQSAKRIDAAEADRLAKARAAGR
jgi:D-alanyl-D-alanine carboxypeptidase